jgi:hypothetical protein
MSARRRLELQRWSSKLRRMRQGYADELARATEDVEALRPERDAAQRAADQAEAAYVELVNRGGYAANYRHMGDERFRDGERHPDVQASWDALQAARAHLEPLQKELEALERVQAEKATLVKDADKLLADWSAELRQLEALVTAA